jgi:hypothetical protein
VDAGRARRPGVVDVQRWERGPAVPERQPQHAGRVVYAGSHHERLNIDRDQQPRLADEELVEVGEVRGHAAGLRQRGPPACERRLADLVRAELRHCRASTSALGRHDVPLDRGPILAPAGGGPSDR